MHGDRNVVGGGTRGDSSLGKIGRQARPNEVRLDFHLFSEAGMEPDGIAGGIFLRIQTMWRGYGVVRELECRAVGFLIAVLCRIREDVFIR